MTRVTPVFENCRFWYDAHRSNNLWHARIRKIKTKKREPRSIRNLWRGDRKTGVKRIVRAASAMDLVG